MDSQNEIVRARLFETLHVCSEAVSAVDSLGKVQLEGNPDKSDMCRVHCKEYALAGSLLFFPLIPHLQCIGTENVHPYRVQVGVNHQGKPLYLSPHVRLEGSTALAVPGWPYPGSKAWVVPFWTIRRTTDNTLCTCTLAEIDVGVIYTTGIGGEHIKVPDTRLVFGKELKLPVITNLVPLEKDSELILYMEPLVKRKPKAKAAPPRKRARPEVKRVPKKPEASADDGTE